LLTAEPIPASFWSMPATIAGGERRHRDRETEGEQEDPGEHLGQVVDVHPEGEQHQHSRARDQRAAAHEQPGAEAVGERAEARGEREHDDALGQQRQPGLQRRVARDLLQVKHKKEEQRRQASVERERLDVADREIPALEQVELQHRVTRA
jgi:hypothetical protein